MRLSNLVKADLKDSLVENILFSSLEKKQTKCDCIFVFGSSEYLMERVLKAVELYQKKAAPFILFSGGNKIQGIEEALVMKKEAILLGVEAKDIIVEVFSSNTLENVLFSIPILKKRDINSLIIVSSNIHIKRCYLTLKKYISSVIKCICIENEYSSINKKNWKNTSINRKRSYEEVEKMIKYIKNNTINDCIIDDV